MALQVVDSARARLFTTKSKNLKTKPIGSKANPWNVERLEDRNAPGSALALLNSLVIGAGLIDTQQLSIVAGDLIDELQTMAGSPRQDEEPRPQVKSDAHVSQRRDAVHAESFLDADLGSPLDEEPERDFQRSRPSENSMTQSSISDVQEPVILPLRLRAPGPQSAPSTPTVASTVQEPVVPFTSASFDSTVATTTASFDSEPVSDSLTPGVPAAAKAGGSGGSSASGGSSIILSGGGGSQQQMSSGAWVYVLDWEDGVTLADSSVATEVESEGDFLQLIAQVEGKEVSSYSWDLTSAPLAKNVSGTSSQKLQLDWGDAYQSQENTISLTVTYTDTTSDTIDYKFKVTNDDTYDPFAGPGSASSRDDVLAPDLVQKGSYDLQSADYAVSSYTGSVQANYVAGGISLSYDSELANPNPIFLNKYEIADSGSLPSTVRSTLTLDSTTGSTIYYDTSTMNKGDILQIALQEDASSLSTGRYSWSIDTIADYGSGDVTTSRSGDVSIINHSASELGVGWKIDGLTKVYEETDGILLDDSGTAVWFEYDSGSSSYLSPDGDFSTMEKKGDDTYTRTLKDGTEINYSTAGLQTSVVDRNGNTITYGYDGSDRLTTVTDPNSRVTTLAYDVNGKLSTITDPASRVTDFTFTADKLTSIEDPETESISYAYDSNDRMTSVTNKVSKTTSFTYGDHGRVESITRPDTVDVYVESFQTQGIAATGTGSSSTPATAILAAGAIATYTDGRSNDWQQRFDWTGFGRTVTAIDAEGGYAVTRRNDDGLAMIVNNQIGDHSTFFRDADGDVTKVWHSDFETESFTYNSFGQVLTHKDTEDKTTTFAYDTDGNLTSVTDPLTNVTSFTYTTDGKIETVTDAESNVTEFEYDSYDRLTKEILADDTPGTNTDNPTIQYTYNSADNVTKVTDQLGNETNLDYDDMDRLIEAKLPDDTPGTLTDNPTYTYEYNAAGQITKQTDPLNKSVTTAYNDVGLVSSVTDQLNKTTSYAYDNEGNVTTVTDPLSRTTTATYDAVGRVLTITDGENNTFTRSYNAAGQLLTTKDPLNNISEFGYNSRGWRTSVTDPLSQVTESSYTSQGWLSSVAQSGGGSETHYTHDDLGRVTKITDADGVYTAYTYDDVGNLLTEKDNLNNTTTYAYDEQNRLVSVTDPLNHTTTYEYDDKGNLVSMTDHLNRETTYDYDERDQIIKVTDPELGETEYAYDLAGRLTSLTDAEDNTTSFTYDAVGRLLTETDPFSEVTTYAYDDAGQMTSITDRLNRVREFNYDDAGRMTSEVWKTGMTTVRTLSYVYNSDGQMTSASDPDTVYTYTFDDLGRIKTFDNTGSAGPDIELTYTYDVDGNVTSVADDLGGTFDYTFTDAGRMATVALAVTGLDHEPKVTLSYDTVGRISNISREDLYTPSGSGGGGGGSGGSSSKVIETDFTYDAAGRVTDIHHFYDTTTIHDYDFTWDAVNQLTQEVSSVDGTVNVSYDDTGQLTAVTGARSESYSFDLTGNRTMTGYTTGTGNRMTSDGTFNYTYDDEGNMLTKTEIATSEVTEFTWDHRNRLTNVKVKDSMDNVIKEIDYTYDVFNKRIGVTVDADGDGSGVAVDRWTVYEGENPYADFDDSGSLTTRYLYGPAIDMLLGRLTDADEIAWHLSDHLGTVRDVVDTQGAVLDHITYDSFGNVLGESSPSDGDRFKYTGREYDEKTGLYYYRARYYDPVNGRFITQDPIGFASGDTNIYRYVNNAPLMFADPTGLTSTLPDPDLNTLGPDYYLDGDPAYDIEFVYGPEEIFPPIEVPGPVDIPDLPPPSFDLPDMEWWQNSGSGGGPGLEWRLPPDPYPSGYEWRVIRELIEQGTGAEYFDSDPYDIPYDIGPPGRPAWDYDDNLRPRDPNSIIPGIDGNPDWIPAWMNDITNRINEGVRISDESGMPVYIRGPGLRWGGESGPPRPPRPIRW